MIFWGWGTDPNDGVPVMITTVLRKEEVWEPRIYAVGKTLMWTFTRGWDKAKTWPDET